jgi:hypothetical protein
MPITKQVFAEASRIGTATIKWTSNRNGLIHWGMPVTEHGKTAEGYVELGRIALLVVEMDPRELLQGVLESEGLGALKLSPGDDLHASGNLDRGQRSLRETGWAPSPGSPADG